MFDFLETAAAQNAATMRPAREQLQALALDPSKLSDLGAVKAARIATGQAARVVAAPHGNMQASAADPSYPLPAVFLQTAQLLQAFESGHLPTWGNPYRDMLAAGVVRAYGHLKMLEAELKGGQA